MFKMDLMRFMKEAVLSMFFDVIVGEDNQAYFADGQNGELKELFEHPDLMYQMDIDHVQVGKVRVEFVLGEDMVADCKSENLFA